MLAVFLLNGGARGVALQAIPEGARGLTKAHMGAILGVATLGVGAEVGVLVQLQDRFRGLLVPGPPPHNMVETSHLGSRSSL